MSQQEEERELQPGEPVVWNYGANQARGHVVEKITEDTKVGSRVYKASADDPKYVVKSDSSGKEAVRKPQTLQKCEEDGDEDRGADGDEAAKLHGDCLESEVGAKEKRSDLNARSSIEEQEESEQEESLKKVQDTGKGSVRVSAGAGQNESDSASEPDDVHEGETKKHAIHESQDNERQVQEVVASLPDEETHVASEEVREKSIVENGEADEGKGHVSEKAEDLTAGDEVINVLPPDEAPVKHEGQRGVGAEAESEEQ